MLPIPRQLYELAILLSRLARAMVIKYRNLHTAYAALSGKEAVRVLEKEHPKLGLAHYGQLVEGVSPLSLMATITSFLSPEGDEHEYRLAIETAADGDRVSKFGYYIRNGNQETEWFPTEEMING